jgi:hypothetical protein
MTDTAPSPMGDTTTSPVIPWDENHPDWDAWWDQAHEIADDHDMCQEFERVVGVMHGKPRPPKHAEFELVTMRVTMDVVVRVDYEYDDIDSHEISERLYGMSRSELVDAIRNGDYEEISREEEDE